MLKLCGSSLDFAVKCTECLETPLSALVIHLVVVIVAFDWGYTSCQSF